MSSALDISTIPLSNISTPLVFLPPEMAQQLNIATYIHFGSLSVLIWDIVNNLVNDNKLLFRFPPFTLPNVAYFVSRISALTYGLVKAFLMTLPFDDCNQIENALLATLIVFIASTTLLFYVRVCAVYNMHKYIVGFFGLLWVATVCTASVTDIHKFSAVHIGPTKYCMEILAGSPSASVFMILTNDTLIFIAVTYKVYMMFLDSDATPNERVHTLFLGRSLPALAKAIMQDAQFYYLVALIASTVITISLYVFHFQARFMFIISHLVLVNIIACRVFRNLKLGISTCEATTLGRHITPVGFFSRNAVPFHQQGLTTSVAFSNVIQEPGEQGSKEVPTDSHNAKEYSNGEAYGASERLSVFMAV
ncbi:hypothetical protein B0H34DRAFT_799509 [Crassisporium funariophilum]|nr:hypothetical protein B0H34DRAFT_799509 [Crassisporium funariophilum]